MDVVANAFIRSVCNVAKDGTIDCVKEERKDDIAVSQGGVASIARWVSESFQVLR